ncbi:GMC oxidoreductase-like protein [Ophiobolus disseminans]|uniref:GMC oxidoreductase-like protein n=1 Tax=Ophiobolus disseminans TaxID=1469910 RepID=A0A6A7A4J0_9PLEO|nr:GMC oxidoreductase-like protein [Ophiobolus disseminans]
MLASRLTLALLLAALTKASHHATVKRHTSDLHESYDFIIAGGGTAGLTVADRLSEAFPKKTILVVEYGEVEYARGGFDPPDIIFGGASSARGPGVFTFQSLPNPEVRNKTAFVFAGKTVGGSSAVNGMYFDRPSRFDHDAWAEAGSPEFDTSEHKWNWEGIFPYFKKSVTFTEPSIGSVQKYGYTSDISAYGGSTPIFSSFPPFLWADNVIARNAWKEMGIREAKECAGGDKEGLCWIPLSQYPVTARRSHAGLGHYESVSFRPNYHILVKHQVVKIMYPDGTFSGSLLVELRSLVDDQFSNLTAKAEVILAAGAFHTPTILYRSGIGAASVLKDAGIPLVLDLPGVGANLQDHSGPSWSWSYTKPGNFSPMPSDMLNTIFAAKATAAFNETPASGPYTLSMANSAIYVSLPNMTADYTHIVDIIRAMATNGSSSAYLPTDYNAEPSLIAGYKRQLSVLAAFLANPEAPSTEVPFATGTSARIFLLHPLSRGTVRLDVNDHLAQPIVDYRLGSNPADFDLHVAHLKFLRRMLDTPTMRLYGAVETGPGAHVQHDAALREYIKDSMTLSFMHPCCTAAMLPRELGGVVGPDLRVHGLERVRIVDVSVLPFLVSAHTSSTAYAVGEKAADIIIRSWLK